MFPKIFDFLRNNHLSALAIELRLYQPIDSVQWIIVSSGDHFLSVISTHVTREYYPDRKFISLSYQNAKRPYKLLKECM